MTLIDYASLVAELAIPHRRRAAKRQLMGAEEKACASVRAGLHHVSPEVRVACCQILDHFLDEQALPDLLENLSHPSAPVRAWAVHALACDRCKEGSCRPGEDQSLSIAIDMMLHDRAHGVRKIAGWWVRGGPRYERTRPRQPRVIANR